MKQTKKLIACVLLLTAVLAWYVFGGSLEPTAAPAPSMKTLDEVEPRIPIPSASSRDPASTFIISMSGSYYLTGNRSCTGTGIEVIADDVTIDLMGYSLSGPGTGINHGIYMNGRKNVEIRNGTVRYFVTGIYEAGSVSGKNHRIIDVRSLSNSQDGIHLYGKNHLVRGCTASDNGTSGLGPLYGIYVGPRSLVVGNTVNGNGDSASGDVYGISAEPGCAVIGNTVCYNGNSAIDDVYGIHLMGDCLVDQNIAYDNGYGTNMTIYGNCTYGVNHAP